MRPSRILPTLAFALAAWLLPAAERQLSTTPVNHNLDNNDNFSRGDRFLCFDTRETAVLGNGSSLSIMKIDVATGAERVIYAPKPVVVDPENAAPGVIAASYNPVADQVVFIHGPFVSETKEIGFYAKTNRRGAVISADGRGPLRFLDLRDVKSAVTPKGAHRGGTHRHEFSRDGQRVGFTYDDHLLTQYGRTVGILVPSAKAPRGATHWFAVLVPVVPAGTAKPGEIETAAFDSWIDPKGLMRGFIGKVKEADGGYRNSLFVVDIPEKLDITTSDSGTQTRYPTPPKGVTVRRLTHTEAGGIVRGSPDGSRIAYVAMAPNGTRQIFLIDAHGSDDASDAARRPVQATYFERGYRAGGFRWHPKGNSLVVAQDNGVAAVCVKPGKLFGKTHFLTSHGAGLGPLDAPLFSNSGKLVAFNRRVPTKDASGKIVKDARGADFHQIFLVDFPDADGDGIADPVEH